MRNYSFLLLSLILFYAIKSCENAGLARRGGLGAAMGIGRRKGGFKPKVFRPGHVEEDDSDTKFSVDDDIIDEDEFAMSENYTDTGEPCALPQITLNGSRLLSDDDANKYADVTSVVFQVKNEKDNSIINCKLECRSGVWRGPYCGGEPFRYGCKLGYISPLLEVRLNHSRVFLTEMKEYPHTTNLKVRCGDEMDYLEGDSSITCSNGQWTSKLPYCIKTTDIESYSDRSPPRILYQVTDNNWHRGREGEIIIQDGAVLHLDCIHDRHNAGTPQWSWSHSYRDYPTGWLASDPERNWKFRISIVYAKQQDSGTFTCSTPRGLQNSVAIRVVSEGCKPLETNNLVRLESTETRIGSNVSCLCPTGYDVRGENSLICRDDGTWSGKVPECTPVVCPALEISSHNLRILRLNNSFMGEAEFDCPFGYELAGERTIWCNQNGQWSNAIPSCKAIECPDPVPPANGGMFNITGRKHYVGSTVQAICNTGFVLIGEPLIRCRQDGLWSGATPHCKRACGYPGIPEHGFINPVKFVYSVGEKINVNCHQGTVLIGENTLECTLSGDWSDRLPRCEPYL